jgi:hypothetical protein
MLNLKIRVLVPVVLCIFSAFTLTIDPSPITSALSHFSSDYPQEKVHLQLDKNYALPGDTMYFKAYVVNAEKNQPSGISNILYVDIINSRNEIDRTLRYKIEDGFAQGMVDMPDTLVAGRYTLRAYTNWMKNFSANLFFKTELRVDDVSPNAKTPPQPVPNPKHDLRFFPEGGNLTDKLNTTVAFKAVGSDGRGEEVSGTITDETGVVVAPIKSLFAGMGRFQFNPVMAHQYVASVKYKDGSTQKAALPRVQPAGYALAVNNLEKDYIGIKVTQNAVAGASNIVLVAQCNGKLLQTADITLLDNQGTLAIPRKKLPTGIIQFTIFDSALKPLAERLVFNDRHDQLKMNVTVAQVGSDATWHKVTISAMDNLLNPAMANFSISITKKVDGLDTGPPSILADLLLTSDLRGTIEDADHYFADQLPQTIEALDNLMLTQGWRRFVWADILSGNYPILTYAAENNLTLSGTVTTPGDKPVAGAKISLLSKGGAALHLDTVANASGRFNFNLPTIFETQQFAVVATAPSGKGDLKVMIDRNPPPAYIPEGLLYTALLPMWKPTVKDLYGPYTGIKGRLLSEVKIKGQKIQTARQKALAPSSNYNGAGFADQVLTYKDLPNCRDLEQCLQGRLTGVYLKPVFDPSVGGYKMVPFSGMGMGKPMLVVIDGIEQELGSAALRKVPGTDVQSVEVLRTGANVTSYGMRGSGGVIVITTKHGGIDYENLNDLPAQPTKGGVFTRYNGYQLSREFYAPTFAQAKQNVLTAGPTLFWKPVLKTDEEGKASLEFFTGGYTGKFTIIVEGLGDDGKIGYKRIDQ